MSSWLWHAESERYFGLENFGNTCYANSVLQSLYFCQPFRRAMLDYAHNSMPKNADENLLTCLADLFVQVCTLGSICFRSVSVEIAAANLLQIREFQLCAVIEVHGVNLPPC